MARQDSSGLQADAVALQFELAMLSAPSGGRILCMSLQLAVLSVSRWREQATLSVALPHRQQLVPNPAPLSTC